MTELKPTKRKYRPRSPLRQRAANLMRRGFDVPPSKLEEFTTLKTAGYRVLEIKEMMGLE